MQINYKLFENCQCGFEPTSADFIRVKTMTHEAIDRRSDLTGSSAHLYRKFYEAMVRDICDLCDPKTKMFKTNEMLVNDFMRLMITFTDLVTSDTTMHPEFIDDWREVIYRVLSRFQM